MTAIEFETDWCVSLKNKYKSQQIQKQSKNRPRNRLRDALPKSNSLSPAIRNSNGSKNVEGYLNVRLSNKKYNKIECEYITKTNMFDAYYKLERDQSWNCYQCTFLNSKNCKKCLMCNADKKKQTYDFYEVQQPQTYNDDNNTLDIYIMNEYSKQKISKNVDIEIQQNYDIMDESMQMAIILSLDKKNQTYLDDNNNDNNNNNHKKNTKINTTNQKNKRNAALLFQNNNHKKENKEKIQENIKENIEENNTKNNLCLIKNTTTKKKKTLSSNHNYYYESFEDYWNELQLYYKDITDNFEKIKKFNQKRANDANHHKKNKKDKDMLDSNALIDKIFKDYPNLKRYLPTRTEILQTLKKNYPNTIFQLRCVLNKKLVSNFLSRMINSAVVYHGTSNLNDVSIIHRGLIIGGTKGIQRAHGAAFGNGIYCSPNISTAGSYAKGSLFICLSNRNFLKNTSGDVWVIGKEEGIIPLYLASFNGSLYGSSWNNSQNFLNGILIKFITTFKPINQHSKFRKIQRRWWAKYRTQ